MCQVPKRDHIFAGQLHLGVAGEADEICDDEAVDGVGFGLADVEVTQAVGLDGIDDGNTKRLLVQKGIERQPVVAGCLHPDSEFFPGRAHGLDELQQFSEPFRHP